MKTFLFQGDSITDCGRESHVREDFGGWGYPTFMTAEYNTNHIEEIKFFNRGKSGDKSINVLNRIEEDIIAIKPDYMSLLIGVNDVWHIADHGSEGAADVKDYENTLDTIFAKTLAAFPSLRAYILEPFVLPGVFTEENWDVFYSETAARSEAAHRIADKYGFPFIPLQGKFFELQKLTPDDKKYWLADGIHPTAAGHYMIGKALLNCFENNK